MAESQRGEGSQARPNAGLGRRLRAWADVTALTERLQRGVPVEWIDRALLAGLALVVAMLVYVFVVAG